MTCSCHPLCASQLKHKQFFEMFDSTTKVTITLIISDISKKCCCHHFQWWFKFHSFINLLYITTYVCKENLPECTWWRCYHPVVWLKDTHTFTPTGNLEFALDLWWNWAWTQSLNELFSPNMIFNNFFALYSYCFFRSPSIFLFIHLRFTKREISIF